MNALWGQGHLPLLEREWSKNCVEYILQDLWRTRRTCLGAAGRAIIRDILQISIDFEIDPVLFCRHLRQVRKRQSNPVLRRNLLVKASPSLVLEWMISRVRWKVQTHGSLAHMFGFYRLDIPASARSAWPIDSGSMVLSRFGC